MKKENIRQLSISDYLRNEGFNPIKEYHSYAMYKSPFREEKAPSFKVDYKANLWYDFGSGEGGSIIDLVMRLKKYSYSETLEYLSNYMGNSQALPVPKHNGYSTKDKMKIIEVKPLQHSKLLSFLNERKIDLKLAKKYCKEVHYQIQDRKYFAIGFKNDVGGYELRNIRFKGCFPPKEITTFNHHTNTVHLFEGFIDYLSMLTKQPLQASCSAVVLNSINNLDKAISFLSKHTKINTFLDNDKSGKQTVEKLKKMNLPIIDYSKKYADYKDVNDYLCGKKIQKKSNQNFKPKGLRK